MGVGDLFFRTRRDTAFAASEEFANSLEQMHQLQEVIKYLNSKGGNSMEFMGSTPEKR